MSCFSCGATVNNGLALCDLCQRLVRTCAEYLPTYFSNLARWRPGRAGSRPVPGSRVLYDGSIKGPGTGDRISDTLDEIANALTTWARVLVDARPMLARLLDRLAAARAEECIDEAQAVAWLCRGFDRYLTSIATTDWCGEFVRDLAAHEKRLRELTETLVPGWYAGACKRCEAATYVVPGLTWVTCRGCGTTTYARDHLETILDEARGWVARPKGIASALVALIDTELSVPRLYDRIRQWAHRGDLAQIRASERQHVWNAEQDRIVVAEVETGHARYRLGDALDLVLTEGATRTSNTREKATA